MQRLRLYDARVSRLPSAIGLCSSDIVGLAQVLNSAERRLIESKEAGDEGWFGSWAEIAFNVSRSTPYVTMPRSVARLELATVCDKPVAIENQFYEYLRFGNGRMPKQFRAQCEWPLLQILSRNNAPGFVDLTGPPKYIRLYPVDPADVGKRFLVQGRDSTGAAIYSQDGQQQAKGIFTVLQVPNVMVNAPLSASPQPFSAITGYQKDVTAGPVQVFQVDPVTGAEVLIHTMEPGETTGWYRRYYFNNLPNDCCFSSLTPGNVQVTAICKLDPIPVVYDTDYFTLQSLEALIEECQAIRYGDMDVAKAKVFEARHHSKAIGLLNGQLAHFLGKQTPAVNFAPFGSANLERVNVGMI